MAIVLGGPVLYLLAESLFRLRMIGVANAERLAVAVILVLLAPIGSQVSALVLSGPWRRCRAHSRCGSCGRGRGDR